MRKSKSDSRQNTDKVPAGLLLGTYLALVVGFITSMGPLMNDIKYVNALRSADVSNIKTSAYSRPQQSQRMFDVSSLLLDNNFNKESLEVARQGVSNFPNSFELWKLLSIQPAATSIEIAEAVRQMKRLDPLNPILK